MTQGNREGRQRLGFSRANDAWYSIRSAAAENYYNEMTPASEAEKLAERILACPSCRRALDVLRSDRCPGCGSQYPRAGSVFSFAPADVGFVASPELAGRIVGNLPQVKRLWKDHEHDPAGPSPLRQLADALGMRDEREVMQVFGSIPVTQVMNDLTRYFSASESDIKYTSTHRFLRERFSARDDSVIIDLGCSVGRHLLEIAGSGRQLAGIDISAFSLGLADAAWKQTQDTPAPLWCAANLLHLPFHSSSFTHALSFVVLGLVPLQAALEEISRILVPDGQLLFTIEGIGYWWRSWESTPLFSAPGMGLVRWWLGRQLLRCGWQWQRNPLARHLAGLVQYTPSMVEDALSRAGFRLENMDVLAEYRGKPALLGVAARKRK